MKTLAEFTKTTLIGGVPIILPIYVSVLLLAKAAKGLLALISPITAGIPASLEFRELLAVLGLAAVCFVAGLIARTGPGLRAKNAFEQAVSRKASRLCAAAGPRRTLHRSGRRIDLCPGARGNRRGIGTGTDHRGTGERILYGAGALGADADGGSAVHSAARARASGRCAAHHGAEGVHEMGRPALAKFFCAYYAAEDNPGSREVAPAMEMTPLPASAPVVRAVRRSGSHGVSAAGCFTSSWTRCRRRSSFSSASISSC